MKKYLILLSLALCACTPEKHKTYMCVFGLQAVSLEDINPDIKVKKDYIILDDGEKLVSFPKTLCIVIQEK